MDSNLYTLEKHVESKLQEARAEAARAALRSALRHREPRLWPPIASLLATIRAGWWRARRLSHGV